MHRADPIPTRYPGTVALQPSAEQVAITVGRLLRDQAGPGRHPPGARPRPRPAARRDSARRTVGPRGHPCAAWLFWISLRALMRSLVRRIATSADEYHRARLAGKVT